MSKLTVRLEIRGLVQGVGYRWTMVSTARALGLHGWVRNRHDGSVEAIVQGLPEAVEKLIAWAHRGPRGARVASVDVYAGEGSFTTFEQRPDG